jgi:hypothetical protein
MLPYCNEETMLIKPPLLLVSTHLAFTIVDEIIDILFDEK